MLYDTYFRHQSSSNRPPPETDPEEVKGTKIWQEEYTKS
jgi:hypothetical protein